MFFQSYESSSSKSGLEDQLNEDITNIQKKVNEENADLQPKLKSESSATKIPIMPLPGHTKKRFKNLQPVLKEMGRSYTVKAPTRTIRYLQSTANADNIYAMMYLNDVERFTKLLKDEKRDKILQMMDDMHSQYRRKTFDQRKASEVK